MELVGHVQALWRYPVKSMLGERLEQLEVDPRGVMGDRGYALWDPQAQRVASAKNPRRWANLLAYSARYLEEPRPGAPLPPVEVHGPLDGAAAPPTSLRSDDPALVVRVDGGCPRCVITTLAQGALPESLEILRATARHNRVTAGIRLSVLQAGPLAVGDPVRLQVG